MKNSRRKPSSSLGIMMASISEDERRHMRDRMMIAARIADAIKTKGLSQKEFAKEVGKSESEVSEWLSGNRNFTVDTLSDISKCLGICLLPSSEMRMRKISEPYSHIKIAKKRIPNRYIIKHNSLIINDISRWNHSEDLFCTIV